MYEYLRLICFAATVGPISGSQAMQPWDLLPADSAPPSAGSIHDALQQLSIIITNFNQAVAKLEDAAAATRARTRQAVSRALDDCRLILATLSRVHAVRASAVRARFNRLFGKVLAECAEEADANALLLDAIACMRLSSCWTLPLYSDVLTLELDACAE